MRRSIHKLTTWLVLVAYMLSGISPAQQLVLCLEPDGTVVLETAEAINCTPSGGADESSREVERLAPDCCPCVDIPLPTQDESPHAKPKAADTDSSWAALAPPCCPAIVTWVEPTTEKVSCASGPPRPAQRLALIRTVILRV